MQTIFNITVEHVTVYILKLNLETLFLKTSYNYLLILSTIYTELLFEELVTGLWGDLVVRNKRFSEIDI